MMTPRAFSDIVLRPTRDAYCANTKDTRTLWLGVLACEHMLALLAAHRLATDEATFRAEAGACIQLHAVRAAARAKKLAYPDWVKPMPGKDEPVDLGYCFVMAANHLVQAAEGNSA
jgi:hypothetical protein